MPNYTYNSNIPASTDNPSTSQGQMQTNCNSVASIVNVDLYGFGQTNGGYHQQVTLPANNVPGAQSGLASTIYSNAGTASNTSSQLFYRNSQFVLPLSIIKAFASVSGTTLNNSYNITSVTNGTTGQYTVNMSITLPSTSYAVIATPYLGGFAELSCSYQIVSTTQFTVFVYNAKGTASGVNVPSISFMVLQV